MSKCTGRVQDCEHCLTRDLSPVCSVDEVLPWVSRVRSHSGYKAGQTIFYAGNTPLGLFTVQSGLVKLEVLTPEGQAHTLRLMGPGSVLGYRALFADEPYRASAITVEPSEICFLSKKDLFEMLAKHPQVGVNLLSHLSKDLRRAEEKWVMQIDKEAPARVAEALLFLHDHFRNQIWTRREIAEWAGTTPETVMRVLSQFEKSQWIRQSGRQVEILSRTELDKKSHET